MEHFVITKLRYFKPKELRGFGILAPVPHRHFTSTHLNHNVRGHDVFDSLDGSSSFGIQLIRELGGLPGTRLHHHVEALLDEGIHPCGRERHPELILKDLLRDADGQLFVRNPCGKTKRTRQ